MYQPNEKGALLQKPLDEDRKSNVNTCLNYINSIIGSGIIGMSYAMMESGVLLCSISLLFMSGVIDLSLRVLVQAGIHVKARSYQELGEHAFGRPGFWLVTILQFGYPITAMISYNIITGDTLTRVLTTLTGWPPTYFLIRREFVILIATLCFTLPLCLYKNIGKLSKVSLGGLFCILFIIGGIYIRYLTMFGIVPKREQDWTLADVSGIGRSYGIILFAFMSHHNSFLLYFEMEDQSKENWARVTHISVFSSVIACFFFGFGGYITFQSWTQGDLLNNYCWDDNLMNLIRVIFTITVLCTYPIECMVTREVVENVLFNKSGTEPQDEVGYVQHFLITLSICMGVMFISLSVDCLGIALALSGLIFAIPMALLLPGMCYIKVSEGSPFQPSKWGAWFLILFSVVVFVGGCYELLVEKPVSCVQDQEMPYCLESMGLNRTRIVEHVI